MTAALTRLQPGMVILFGGVRYAVRLVNESRAYCVPIQKETKVYVPKVGKDAGKEVVFETQRSGISISPNSECEILEWRRRAGVTTCRQMRRIKARFGRVNMITGMIQHEKTSWETTKPCGAPLFSDREKKAGKCDSCLKGWTHPHNFPIAVRNAKTAKSAKGRAS